MSWSAWRLFPFFLVLSFFLLISARADAQIPPAYLVRDIDPFVYDPGTGAFENFPSSYEFTASADRFFFIMDDVIHGLELWTSDGTEAGTRLVRDICPGTCSSWPRSLTSSNGLLFFAADDGSHGVELWKSDGTTAGTELVKDIRPGLTDHLGGFLSLEGSLFFAADEGVHGQELWKSDGTAAGTQLVRDINPGPQGSAPRPWAAGGGLLLLKADDGSHGREPWISDGTEAGTVSLANGAFDAPDELSYRLGEDALALPGGGFLFAALGDQGPELRRTDGTPAGTTLLKTFGPLDLHSFTAFGGRVFFAAPDPDHGMELWATDLTATGTVLVEDIRPGKAGSFPLELTAVGGKLFFQAHDGIHGEELWVSDGTSAGTVLVKDIQPGPAGAFFYDPLSAETFRFAFSNLGGELVFAATNGSGGVSLWRSNGTEAGTVQVPSPLDPRFLPAFIFYEKSFLVFEDRLYYHSGGATLTATDGTTAGTALVKAVVIPRSSIDFDTRRPRPMVGLGGNLIFRANDGVTGYEPWRSDGTEAGTFLLQDVSQGISSGNPYWLTPFGSSVLFSVVPFSQDESLWKTDGTPGGTVLLYAPSAAQLTVLGSSTFFTSGDEVWKTDGTAAGTVLLKDIVPGGFGSSPGQLTVSGGLLFFTANDEISGPELWKSDGTEAGTVLVKDIVPSNSPSDPAPHLLTDNLGTLFFFAGAPGPGTALWKSDGTEAGTVPVKDLMASGNPRLRPVAASGGLLFFVAQDGNLGYELWRSDGTEAGTFVARDIFPGPHGSEPNWLTAVGDKIYFSADDGVHGRELWVSDGTEAGTRLVEDIAPGITSSRPRELLAQGSVLVFTASDGIHGLELWRSDGTELGTRMLQDIAPGPQSASPRLLTPAGPNLYFAANDSVTGFEPWVIPRSALLSTFADVPADFWAWPFVEALAGAGLTTGCAPDRFCPGNPVSRAEIALFLARGTRGPGFVPPPATGTVFADVPASHWAAAWIEQLAADGLTGGCGVAPARYCPSLSLTRDSMAIFLLRAKHGSGYTPPPATGTVFADVPASHWAAPWIEQLAAEGITAGCAPGRYCPGDPVNRAQAAAFLTRTFDLPLP